MKTVSKTLAGLVLLAFCVPAFAGSCPKDMKEIDAALAANPSVSASDLERIMELRASGEQLHKSGKHAESVKDLHEAKKLLGI